MPDLSADFIMALCVVGGIVCIAIAYFGEDNIDAPDWFDSTWF